MGEAWTIKRLGLEATGLTKGASRYVRSWEEGGTEVLLQQVQGNVMNEGNEWK